MTDPLGRRIRAARAAAQTLTAPLDHGLTPERAYRIQGEVLAPRLAEGGGRGGWKLGYTSAAMREQMGVSEPNYGPLSRSMILDASTPEGAIVGHGVTQPKVEPEIAAVLARTVPRAATIDQIHGCVGEWRLALEIVDSVWEGYRFDWALNTADGSSAAFVALGPVLVDCSQPGAADVDLGSIEVVLHRNGRQEAKGRADAAMGDPATALQWLAHRLDETGESLHAGDVVITGGLTPAVDFRSGDVVEAVTCLGPSGTDVRAGVRRR